MPDGSVEIRISGVVDPSVAASASQAKAAYTGLGDSVAVSSKAMAAALAATGGSLKAITPEMLGLAAATKANAAAATEDAVATGAETVAKEANTAATINSRAAYESLVLVHEALQGRFTRMAGSSMILTQQLAGQANVAKAVQFAMSGAGIATLGAAAAIGVATAATISYEEREKELMATALGAGAAAGLTAEQLDKIGKSASIASQSIGETTKAAEAFAAAGVRDEETVQGLANSIQTFAQLTGTKFADAEKKLAEAMRDPVRGAKDLHDQLGILNGDQIEQIQRLSELGDKQGAINVLYQAYKERIDDANRAGVGAVGTWGEMKNAVSSLYTWLGNVNDALLNHIGLLGDMRQAAAGAAGQEERLVQAKEQLDHLSAAGAKVWDSTPEGQAAARRAELQGSLNDARKALAADTELVRQGKEKADVLVRDRQAIADYTHATSSYLTEVQKKTKADALDVQIAAAKHAHNKQLVADLTQQKALLAEAGKVESQADANALAKGAGDVAGARTGAGRKGAKGPSIVSEWEEQLHAAEVASGEFFKDQTADELKFWEGKVGLVRKGSKDWLAVQTKIYDASKTLAHQAFDEQIARDNAQIEADRDNWNKEKADWDKKLSDIKGKLDEESKEYLAAYREWEAAERQHNEEMRRAQREYDLKEIEAQKQHLSALRSIREEYARAAETVIQDRGGGSPFGDISAATKIGQLHHQLILDEMADAQKAYQQDEVLRQQDVEREKQAALAALTADKNYSAAKAALERGDYTLAQQLGVADLSKYKAALQTKINADKQYYDQKKALEAKAYAQQVQDLQRLKAAYHQYIDGTVNATVSGFANMADGTGTFRDAVIGVYNSIKSTAEQVISQMISNWIVNLLVGQAAQKQTAVSQVLSYAGIAGAAGTASWAGAPWPIDMGAPAFGAAMANAAGAYATLASLDVGTNYLPRDQIVQAHAGERIIPRADNRKLIELVNLAVNGGGGGGRSGDIHFHNSPTFNGNQTSLWQHLVDKESREMRRWIKREFDNGHFRTA